MDSKKPARYDNPMNVLNDLIDCWSRKFNSIKYPPEFYFSCIEEIRKCSSSLDLCSLIKKMLCWKDGKVQKDPFGKICVGGVLYSMAQPKPNTYDSKRHDPIFQDDGFFNWVKEFMQCESFKSEVVSELTDEFKIYSSKSIILPSFLAHILNPRIFPLYDQHVERSRRFFSALSLNNNAASELVNENETPPLRI